MFCYDYDTGKYLNNDGESIKLQCWALSNDIVLPRVSSVNDGAISFFLPLNIDECMMPNEVMDIDLGISFRLPKGLIGKFWPSPMYDLELVIKDTTLQETKRLYLCIKNISPLIIGLGSGDHIAEMYLFQSNYSMEVENR